ncbi:MAG: ribosome-associated translation inhibitor RaiA [Finegoldia sp.]|nr:ribosome-associated translation inhibitor RaiA [Finegoldia sp.]
MKINYATKDIKLTDDIKDYTEKKLAKLDKYFNKEQEARVVFKAEANKVRTEVTIILDGGTVLRAEESDQDMKASMDRVLDSISRQTRKHKTRLKKRYQDKETIRFELVENETPDESEENQGKIVREKELVLKPMTSEEALLQMELLNHNFFIYEDQETSRVQLLYKRNDGNYGLLIPKIND